MKRIKNPEVAEIFARYPRNTRAKLMALRQLIFEVAAETEGVGQLAEVLKWGQPSYLTSDSGSGSTIRIDQVKSQTGRYAMYFHCQTTLIDTFKQRYREEFKFSGNRAILFDEDDEVPMDELRDCISIALTYHLNKAGMP